MKNKKNTITVTEVTEFENAEKKQNVRDKKWLKIFAVTVGILIAFSAGMVAGYFTTDSTTRTLAWVADYISQYGYYTDENGELREITSDDMAKAIANTLLDKYSAYYTAEEYSDVVYGSQGNNIGIGVSFLSADDACVVFKVSGNSPAEKAGIKKGDEIVSAKKVGEEKTDFANKTQLLSYLSAIEKGETVSLFIRRDGESFEKTVVKSEYQTSYVYYLDNEKSGKFSADDNKTPELTIENISMSDIFDSDTAYIKLEQFEGRAAEQFGKAIELFNQRGKEKLILDLRDNGGGSLSVLTDIAAYLIKTDSTNPVVAYAKDSNGKITEYRTTGNGNKGNFTKVAIIANQNSASASECLIGALKYYLGCSEDLLVIDSESGRTYGKGIMQTTFKNLLTGAAIKLTTARLFLPDKTTSIHGIGFTTKDENIVDSSIALKRAQEVLRG